MGGVVPLSEHEQRQLEQIEQALYREDRRLGRLVRSSDPRVHYRRRILLAVIGILVGGGLVAAGLITRFVWHAGLVAAGAALVVLCAIWALAGWRHLAGIKLGVAGPDGVVRPRKKKKGRKATRQRPGQGGMMDRLDERWRRRQDGDL
jgi:hypothetical protein